MSADAITTCPRCLECQLREFYDLYSVDESFVVVDDEAEPVARPVMFVAEIELRCRACGYQQDLLFSAPLVADP